MQGDGVAMKKLAIITLLFALSAIAEPQAKVARMWHGKVPRSRADEYQAYLDKEGVQKLRAIKDNLGAQLFRRDDGDVTEFVVISYWPSRDAIHAYAGADIEKVHDLPRDKEFLIDPERTVKHFDIVR
jgi:heme-degrading monooxygenase HmoA